MKEREIERLNRLKEFEKKLYEDGINQAKNLGIEVKNEEVLKIIEEYK